MLRFSVHKIPRERSGFTLVEMAMVLVIIGLVMLTVLPALNAARSANQYATTQSNLHSLMLATAAYVQANGCLPCPANPDATANFGATAGGSACGCSTAQAEGIPPYVALGIPPAVARDGWGYWITMRIDPELGTNFGVVPPAAPCQCSDLPQAYYPSSCPTTTVYGKTSCTILGASQKGLCTPSLSTATGAIPIVITSAPDAFQSSTQNAAVVFVSFGPHGYGSYIQHAGGSSTLISFPATTSPSNAQLFAQDNAAGTKNFYDMLMVANPDFQNILAYANRNMLVSLLGNTGCQTVW